MLGDAAGAKALFYYARVFYETPCDKRVYPACCRGAIASICICFSSKLKLAKAQEAGISLREALIKWYLGNAQLFRLARHEVFLKQEWTLPSSTVSFIRSGFV